MEKKHNRLTEQEGLIEISKMNFHLVGKALKEILDKRLYRLGQFSSFENYVKERWDMTRSYAYRLIDAAKVYKNLSPIGDILPENEAQARPLAQLEPLEQKKIWHAFIQIHVKFNARTIKQFLKDHEQAKPESGIDRVKIISEDYHKAVATLLQQIRVAQNDDWQATSRDAALHWHQIMREKIVWKI